MQRVMSVSQTNFPLAAKQNTCDWIFFHSSIGQILTDDRGHVLAINDELLKIAGSLTQLQEDGVPIWNYIHISADEQQRLRSGESVKKWHPFLYQISHHGSLSTTRTNPDHLMEIIIIPLTLENKEKRGFLVQFLKCSDNDKDRYQEQQHYKDLQCAYKKNQLLHSIVRHDIMNKITAIQLRAETALEDLDLLSEPGHAISCILQDIKNIESIFCFTSLYQEVGTVEPTWQILRDIVPVTVENSSLRITGDLDGVMVYADIFLNRVFYDLIDNSIRHGKIAQNAEISWQICDDSLLIIYKDDGIGISTEDKERIFERGFGKNTGLGLFLIREILQITGCSIRETGISGQGAFFEIRIPAGNWRVSR